MVQENRKTKLGTNLQFSSFLNNKGGITVSITQQYYDLLDGENVFTSINVDDNNLEKLKSEFKQIINFYIKWSIVAEDNDIRELEKEIPIAITAFQDFGCASYGWNSDIQRIKPVFKVYNFEPYLELSITLGFQNKRHYMTKWRFKDGEIQGFVEEIEIMMNNREKDEQIKIKPNLSLIKYQYKE